MAHFDLDVTKPVGDISLKTPEGPIVYDIMAITKEPMALFEKMALLDTENMPIHDQMLHTIEAVSSVMRPQNGGPPAKELFTKLYDDGVLGMNHMRELGEFVQNTAVGNPPA